MKTKKKKIKTKKNNYELKHSSKKSKTYKRAISVLHNNSHNIEGIINFIELPNNKLRINYNIIGLKNGKHGFHIHEYGDLSDGCSSACKHFNPTNKNHGGLNSKERHLGDLGNIETINGITKGELIAKNINLSKLKHNIIGRMIIIHEDEDDLGMGIGKLKKESLKTGNAGKRLACGVIGLK